MQCFSVQVVMNKCFLTLKKIDADLSGHFQEKRKNRSTPTHIKFRKNDVTEPKARLL